MSKGILPLSNFHTPSTKISLQATNIQRLCHSLVEVAHNSCPSLTPSAQAICDRHTKAFSLFSSCHSIYGQMEVTEADITILGNHPNIIPIYFKYRITYHFRPLEKNVVAFMAFYREAFPLATVTPKLHMLEEHTVPWLQKWHAGFGMMGEQGAESIHADFNQLERNHSNLKHHRVERLKRVVNDHLIRSSPSMVVLEPERKKYKSTESATNSGGPSTAPFTPQSADLPHHPTTET